MEPDLSRRLLQLRGGRGLATPVLGGESFLLGVARVGALEGSQASGKPSPSSVYPPPAKGECRRGGFSVWDL